MAENNKLPLSVADTVDRFNPAASVLEGLAGGLNAFLQTRFQLDQARAQQQQEQQKIDIQAGQLGVLQGQLTEAERANKANEARTRREDSLSSRIDELGILMAQNKLEHQQRMLAWQERVSAAKAQGRDHVSLVTKGLVAEAIRMEALAAEQKAQGQLVAASELNAVATGMWNMARLADPDVFIPTTGERRIEAYRNLGFNPEEIQMLEFIEENPNLTFQERADIANDPAFTRIRGAILPPEALINEEKINAAIQEQVKTTEAAFKQPIRDAGSSVKQTIRDVGEHPAARAVIKGSQDIGGFMERIFGQRKKTAQEVASESEKKREEIVKERNKIGGQ